MPGMSDARAVLVTGASTGIGEATATLLAAHGFRVFAGVRKAEDFARWQLPSSGNVVPVTLDVTDEDSIRAARAEIEHELRGRGLYGLVNNAGVALGGPLECTSMSIVRRVFEVNVYGALTVTQAMLPLVRRERGRIVNMSSISGRVAFPFAGQYAASKFALRALSDSLRVELRRWGVEVVMIEPGQIATPIWKKGIADCEQSQADWSDEARAFYGPTMTALLKHVSGVRGLPPERVAEAVLRALTARRPKTCYVVGRDSRMLRWIGRLPPRWRDWLFARQIPAK
jgi:NAD(P)-dependent dehydrogenase (short-subunit alcohol dehydrogenase family)